MSVRVDEASFKQTAEGLSLLICVSTELLLQSTSFDVDFLVRYVQVSCQYNGLLLVYLKSFEIVMKIDVPLIYSVLLPAAASAAVRYVGVYQDEMLELESDRSSFIDEFAAEVELDPKWLNFRENCGT